MLAPLAQIPFTPILFYTFYLYYMLDIIASYHCLQFPEKLMNHTWENAKKPSFVTKFGPFGPNLSPRNFFRGFYLLDFKNCCKLSLRAVSRKTNEPNLRPILVNLAQIQVAIFLKKSSSISH